MLRPLEARREGVRAPAGGQLERGKGRHLPVRGGQDIPEKDGVPHAEDMLLVWGEGHSLHRL